MLFCNLPMQFCTSRLVRQDGGPTSGQARLHRWHLPSPPKFPSISGLTFGNLELRVDQNTSMIIYATFVRRNFGHMGLWNFSGDDPRKNSLGQSQVVMQLCSFFRGTLGLYSFHWIFLTFFDFSLLSWSSNILRVARVIYLCSIPRMYC